MSYQAEIVFIDRPGDGPAYMNKIRQPFLRSIVAESGASEMLSL